MKTARDFGQIYLVEHIWRKLGIDRIILRQSNDSAKEFDLEQHIRLMVTNRLCDPTSKLGLLRWLEGVHVPGVDPDNIEYHKLLRAMDWLIDKKREIETEIAREVLTLFDQELDLAFYDIISTYFEGEHSIGLDDFRAPGYSRDKRADCVQIVLGIVMSKRGIPIAHHVFAGNRQDKTTLQEIIRDLRGRFGVRRITFIADRGMLSDEDLEVIIAEEMDYIISYPLRQNDTAKEVIKKLSRYYQVRLEKKEW